MVQELAALVHDMVQELAALDDRPRRRRYRAAQHPSPSRP